MQLDLFSVVIVALVVLVGGYALFIQLKTKKKGIEAEAVITAVREDWERLGESDSLRYTYTVEYENFAGQKVTAALGGLSDGKKDLREGDRILVRYLKEKQDYPIMVKKLS